MEWGQWATLGFAAVGALTGVAQGYFALVRHRRERSGPMREKAARWSLRRRPPFHYEPLDESAAGWTLMQIKRRDEPPALTLQTLRVLRPSGARIAFVEFAQPKQIATNSSRTPHLFPDVSHSGRRLDFVARRAAQPHSEPLDAELGEELLFVRLPGLWLLNRAHSLRIEACASEISAMRRSVKIVLTSEPLIDTASVAAKAT